MFDSAHKPVQDQHLVSLHRDDLLPQAPQGMRRGLILALAAHAVLIACIAFGVHWSSSEPTGAQAELWAAVPQTAAERAPAPQADPTPPPPPRPEPKRAVEPPPPAKPAPDPQIAIEREKARKEKQREDKLKAEREEARLDKLARDKKEREDKLRDDKKAADQKQADKKKQQQLEQQRADAVRAEQLLRNKKLLDGPEGGQPGGTSDRTAAPSNGYGGRVKEAVYPNIIFSEMQRASLDGNPATIVEVRLGADGTIIGSRIKKSSGVPAWDAAVLRALERTQKLPLDNGRVISPMDLNFQPNN